MTGRQSQLSKARKQQFARTAASSNPLAGVDFHLGLITATAQRADDLQDLEIQARVNLDRATRLRNDLQIQRAFASADFGFAQVNVGAARANLAVFDAAAPHVNFAIDAAQNLHLVRVAQEGFALTSPMQSADREYQTNKFTFDAGATLAKAILPASAELLDPAMALYDLHDKWRDANQALIAQQHQREPGPRGFGGVLSTANLPRISFAPSPFDLTSGSSFKRA